MAPHARHPVAVPSGLVLVTHIAEITEQLGCDPLVMGSEALFVPKASANKRLIRRKLGWGVGLQPLLKRSQPNVLGLIAAVAVIGFELMFWVEYRQPACAIGQQCRLPDGITILSDHCDVDALSLIRILRQVDHPEPARSG